MFDLGGGGAERVLVNLVNNLNPQKYDITVRTIFGGGVNSKFLKPHIRYTPFFKRKPIRGFVPFQKLFSPQFLHKLFIKGDYDIEIAFMQHTPTRIIAGSKSKSRKFAWIHTRKFLTNTYKSRKELIKVYSQFDKIAFVSKESLEFFKTHFGFNPNGKIIYNIIDSERIKELSRKQSLIKKNDKIKLCSVGRFSREKGFDRLIRVLKKIQDDGFSNWELYLIGEGELRSEYESLINSSYLSHKIKLLGFQDNPYKFMKDMDLYVCPSITEGYSTSVAEAIILGIPVITTHCSGMEEIIGNSNSGIIVPNNEEDLYSGLKSLLLNHEIITEMKKSAESHSINFSTKKRVKEFEKFIGTL